ncbi:hypothetical protein SS50377_27028 [Spironucleus salmonicida]|uniref:Transmembrane protein n=1 Tax=Spironucleus salmonicida TaxID=348837 RepID=V6LTF7_9EUKA|nr:hypothetical protein SS50377_27028 [Spironucleus salmonicida]|eukprot:EST47538.1 Hypothetical protein SS50377_12522 [Spironucleus salmonicida]
MLAVLSNLTCFKQTGQVIGQQQQGVLYLILNPLVLSHPLCIASQGESSEAIIHFETKSVSQSFIYKNEEETIISFDLSSDRATFNSIFDTSVISYEVKLSGSLIVTGPIQSVNLVKLNVSNCWSDLQVVYSRVKGQEFIEMSGTPLLCKIETPVVVFQYQVNNDWKSLDIKGSSDGADFYDSTKSYDYTKILFYKQALASISDNDQKQILNQFFNQFQMNRSLQVRFQFTTADYQIIANIDQLSSSNTKCISTLNPSGFLTTRYLDMGLDNKDFITNSDCSPDAVYFLAQSFAKTNVGIIYGGSIAYKLPAFQARSGIQFDFDKPLMSFHKVKEAVFVLYLTAYDINNNILLESSFEGPVFVSCIDYVEVTISQKEGGCAAINYYDTEKCLSGGVQLFNLTFTAQLDGFESRTTYFAYSLEFTPSTKIIKKCSNQLTTRIMGQNSTLPLSKRFSRYSKIVRDGQGVYIALSNPTEFINWYMCNLDINFMVWTIFSSVCIATVIFILIFVYFQVRQLN